MNKLSRIPTIATAVFGLAVSSALAGGHATPMLTAADQSVSNGIVSAESVVADKNGWLVVHRTTSEMKPGPVIGHAPLRAGENIDVAAILTEDVNPDDILMLMIHSEEGGNQTGIFEYTLGATEDGPIRVDDKLVMMVVTAQ